jgi:hypothetical protein
VDVQCRGSNQCLASQQSGSDPLRLRVSAPDFVLQIAPKKNVFALYMQMNVGAVLGDAMATHVSDKCPFFVQPEQKTEQKTQRVQSRTTLIVEVLLKASQFAYMRL